MQWRQSPIHRNETVTDPGPEPDPDPVTDPALEPVPEARAKGPPRLPDLLGEKNPLPLATAI
jgi:hypothetical protein